MPELWELAQMQSLPLSAKIIKTRRRVQEWYDHWDGDVYLSFSGGKDSTVLKDIIDRMRLDIPSVFIDTGLEYPEVRDFARSQPGVTILRPEMNFRQVILQYGYPVASKEIAQIVREAKIGLRRNDGSYLYRIQTLNGERKGKDGKPSRFNKKKWKFLLDAPFEVSEQCCKIMKKDPAKRYERETGRHPIIATMAEESAMRKQRWLRYGCNAFNDSNRPASNPMSFWTEKDVLLYLLLNDIPYAKVYGDIVAQYLGCHLLGRSARWLLKTRPSIEQKINVSTTGADRTGCMFCCFGCHLEKEPNRFQRIQHTHPKQWEYCLKPVAKGGLGLKEVLDYIKVPYSC